MKKIAFLFLIFLHQAALATNYYFSDVSGNDSRTSTQAQNPATPWKSINKLNSFLGSLANGDSILFKAGETFYGEIVMGHDHIKFGRYGTGAKPVVTGFYTIPAWSNVSGNIWESTDAVSTLSSCNIISKNGVFYSQGRTPNTGFWTIRSTGGNSITDGSNLNSSSTNWTGAQVVMRKYRWIMDKYTISSASGSTINFTSSGDAVRAGWGYFIMNDQRCLDQANEWSYNSSTKKISIYSVGSPSGTIKVSALSTAVTVNGYSNCSFTNIVFTGFNTYGINAPADDYLTVTGCDFSFIGNTGIYQYFSGGDASNCLISGNTFTDMGSMGIHAGSSSNSIITGNNLLRIGHYPGMGGNGDVSYCAIQNIGDNQTISYNTIRAVGYCGIRWDGDATMIRNNFVDSTNYVKDDGGGIYVYPNATGPNSTVTYTQRTVRDNIVLNSIGAIAGGTPSSNFSEAMGIYNDGTSPNVTYKHNTIANCQFGLFSNSGRNNVVDSNTIFNCVRGLHIVKYGVFPLDNWTITYNRCVAKESNQYAAYYEPGAGSIPGSWTMNYNAYTRPISDNTCIWADFSGTNYYYTLAQWKSISGKDASSVKAFKSITTTSDIQLIYNPTASTKTVSFQGVWSDIISAQPYTSSIELPAMSSAILLRTSTPPLPITTVFLMAKADGSQFSWQSTDEENLAYYIVEESADNGKTWKEVVKTAAVGPSKYLVKL